MAFADTNSLVAADLNNMLRGLYRDNTTHTVTATASETDMGSVSLTAGIVGTTGALHILASGNVTNSASGTKTIKLYLATTLIATVSRTGANNQNWVIHAWMFNTAANAQRWIIRYSTADSTATTSDYTTSSVDTASSQTLKLTGTLTSGSDSIVQAIFDVFVCQIT